MAKDMVRHLMAQNLIVRRVNADELRAARAVVREFRGSVPPLLTDPNGNTKLAKSERPTYGLSLLPANLSVKWSVCRYSTPGCREVCLNTAGKGRFDNVQYGRFWKTMFLGEHPQTFLDLLVFEVDLAVAAHGQIALRLNVISDIPWERVVPNLFVMWQDDVVFYDYTKWPDRRSSDVLDVTFSASENTTYQKIVGRSRVGENVAVVFDTPPGVPLPSSWHGVPVVDGDESDDRARDDRGVIVGLRAKGKAKRDTSGFVRKVK